MALDAPRDRRLGRRLRLRLRAAAPRAAGLLADRGDGDEPARRSPARPSSRRSATSRRARRGPAIVAPDVPAQRPPPPLLGRAGAVVRATARSPRRAAMAHLLTDEAFALVDRPLPAARAGRRAGLLDRARSCATFIPWNLATLAGVTLGGQIADPARLGHRRHLPGRDGRPRRRPDHRPPRARRGGRRRRRSASSSALAVSPSAGIIAGGVLGPFVGLLVPAADGRTRPRRSGRRCRPSTTRCRGTARRGPSSPRRRPDRPMSTDLVPLAVLMFAVTYPSRAVGLLTPGHRPPAQRRPRLPPARRAGGPRGARRGRRDGRRRSDAAQPIVPRRRSSGSPSVVCLAVVALAPQPVPRARSRPSRSSRSRARRRPGGARRA